MLNVFNFSAKRLNFGFFLLTVNFVENLCGGGGPVTFIASKGQIVVNQIPNLIYS